MRKSKLWIVGIIALLLAISIPVLVHAYGMGGGYIDDDLATILGGHDSWQHTVTGANLCLGTQALNVWVNHNPDGYACWSNMVHVGARANGVHTEYWSSLGMNRPDNGDTVCLKARCTAQVTDMEIAQPRPTPAP